jgi:hypothetical protein
VGGCGLRPPRVISLGVGGLRVSGDKFVTFLHGEVSPEVAALRVELADGRILDAPIYTPPSQLALTFNFFVIPLEGEEVEGRVVALGSGGETLAGEPIPSEPQAPGFFEVLDAFGNVVSYVPEAGFQDGPPWSAPGERADPEVIR